MNILKKIGDKYGYNFKFVYDIGDWDGRIKWEIQDENHNIYFLKQMPYYLEISEFIKTLEIQQFLLNNGLRTAKIIKSLDEEEVVEVEGKYYVITEWIDSISINGDCYEVLKEIVKIQASSAKILRSYEKGRMNEPSRRVTDLIDVSPNSVNYLFNSINDFISNDEISINIIENSRKWILKRMKEIDWSCLIQTWIHGDFHINNILFTKDEKYIPIDFDDTHWGYQVCDLIWTLVIQSLWNTDYLVVRSKLNFNTLNKNIGLINEYNVVNQLCEEEMKSIPLLLVIMFIRSLVTNNFLNDLEHRPERITVNLVENQIKFISELIKYAENLNLMIKINGIPNKS